MTIWGNIKNIVLSYIAGSAYARITVFAGTWRATALALILGVVIWVVLTGMDEADRQQTRAREKKEILIRRRERHEARTARATQGNRPIIGGMTEKDLLDLD